MYVKSQDLWVQRTMWWIAVESLMKKYPAMWLHVRDMMSREVPRCERATRCEPTP